MKQRQHRVGPRMQDVASFVRRSGEPVPLIRAAEYVAPTGVPGGKPGLGYGYRTVHRAILAGVVDTIPHPTVAGRVLLVLP